MARGLAGGMPILDAEPRLIALDWGTTHARGYLLAAGGLGPVIIRFPIIFNLVIINSLFSIEISKTLEVKGIDSIGVLNTIVSIIRV